ncbi:MAG: hypothetical protein HKO64_06005 [Xanthomonadales bacterium]|nr:hypothetical protein [Xanthomonadales bacterium]NNL95157.1 hypothetical protein [Xanthomonadales bacterium]
MNRWYLVLVAIAVLAGYVYLAGKQPGNGPLIATSTFETGAELHANGQVVPVAGRNSISLSASAKQIASGEVRVKSWNVAMFGVPMKFVSAEQQPEPESGLLGFAVSDATATLDYDAASKTLSGQLTGYVDNAYLSRFRVNGSHGLQGPQNDLVETATQQATLTVALELDDTLSLKGNTSKVVTGRFKGQLRVKSLALEHVTVPAYSLVMIKDFVSIDVASPEEQETYKSLCVQPYNVAKPPDLVEKSGTGYGFGTPAAQLQWDKVDVVFDFQEMLTATGGEDFWVIESTITEDEIDVLYLPNEVEGCIEVFFVHGFDPYHHAGGGWAQGGGTGTAKVVISDGSQRIGESKTLMAHELGHVLGLKHPGSSASLCPDSELICMRPATPGTLMCTSGITFDTPQNNSEENERLLQNPLLINAQRALSEDWDCKETSDCGPCNP